MHSEKQVANKKQPTEEIQEINDKGQPEAGADQVNMRASASMKKATVEPVPTPTMLPSSTYSAALSPDRRLPSSFAIVLLRQLEQFARRPADVVIVDGVVQG